MISFITIASFKVSDIQNLYIPMYLESAVAALDIVYDDITGKTFIPVMSSQEVNIDGYDITNFYEMNDGISNMTKLSDISRKLSYFMRDGIKLTKNAFGNGGREHDATLRQMRIIVKNGVVMSRNIIQPAAHDEAYYAAFLNQKFSKAEVLEGFDESYKVTESYFDIAYDFASVVIRSICDEERLIWSK